MIDSLASSILDMAGAITGAHGSWTVSRLNELRGADSKLATACVLNANAALGASSLTLARSGPVADLAGSLPVGLTLTIGAAQYTLAAPAVADAGLIVVAIAPVLPGALLAGQAVTVGKQVAWTLPVETVKQDVRMQGLSPTTFEAGIPEFELVIPKASAPSGFVPNLYDLISGDDNGAVLSEPQNSGGVWAIVIGRRGAS